MKEMYFESILIADIQEHRACFHSFSKGLNIITSKENHVGKSSLVKSLYYALGAEVSYDDAWAKNTKIYALTFMVDDKEYKIVRYQKAFALFEGEKLILHTHSVSHDLTKKLGEILNFTVYLPNKKSQKIELAPPAFTFMPYYVDQDRGWTGLYNSFSSLDQYNKGDRIKSLYYHLNIYTEHTIELMNKQDNINDELSKIENEVKRIKVILNGLSQEMQNLMPADTMDELEVNLKIPKEEISLLVNQLGIKRNKIQELEAVYQQHYYQLEIISEYHKIKSKSEPKNETKINICPNCGYTFDEEIYDIVRSNYNLRNEDYMCQQIQLILGSIKEELYENKKQYLDLMSCLKEKEKAYDESLDSYKVYTKQRGLEDSVSHFNQQLGDYELERSKYLDQLKQIKKELLKFPNKKEVEDVYINYVRMNIVDLGAWNPAYEGNIKLLKPIKAQGTLENKIILSQIVGLFQTMDHCKSSAIRLPFVVDSPRGKEASTSSSKGIVNLICRLKMLPQVILATIDYNKFAIKSKIFNTSTIILKEEKSLLNATCYVQYQEYIEDLLDLLSEDIFYK